MKYSRLMISMIVFILIGNIGIGTGKGIQAAGTSDTTVYLESRLSFQANDNFDMGSIPSAWVALDGLPVISLSQDPVGGGNKCLKFASNISTYAIDRKLAVTSGKMVVSFRTYFPSIANAKLPSIYGTDENSNSQLEAFFINCTTVGVMAFNGEGSSYNFNVKKWDTYNIYIDTDTDTYDLVRNGQLLLAGRPFQNKIKDVTSIRFRTSSEAIYIDDFKVGRGYLNPDKFTQFRDKPESFFTKMPKRNNMDYRVLAYKASKAPIVDGDISDEVWKYAKKYRLEKRLEGNVGVSVCFYTAYDDKYLYIAAKAYDLSLHNNSKPLSYLDSSFEVYLDGKNEKNSTYDENDRQYSYGWTYPGFYQENETSKTNAEGVIYGQKDVPDGWTMEVAVPFDNISAVNAVGTVIGFDMGYNESAGDGTRKSQIMWAGNSTNFKNTAAFGLLELMDGTVEEHYDPAANLIQDSIIMKIGKTNALVRGRQTVIEKRKEGITPFIQNDCAYLPSRFLAEIQGGDAEWDRASQSYILKLPEVEIRYNNGGDRLWLNDKEYIMAQPALTLEGLSYLPVRDVCAAMGQNVLMCSDGTIIISSYSYSAEEMRQYEKKIMQASSNL